MSKLSKARIAIRFARQIVSVALLSCCILSFAQTAHSDKPLPNPSMDRAVARRPNVLLILLDDVGFADPSTFGGAIATPALNRLAHQGLRYTNFNTASMCSPTRAALLTGRNHHQIGFGRIANLWGPEKGYATVWPKETASIARVLRDAGYSTAAFGKWHNTPEWEISPVGPFERWPTGIGFEAFYGFMAGAQDQWQPTMLYRGTMPIDLPQHGGEPNHLTTALTDESIRWVRTHVGLAPNTPWFVYFSPGAAHWPHQAPQAYIERYRGHFDQGWDVLRQQIFARQRELGIVPPSAQLSARPQGLPAWSSLSTDERRLYARQMEVYAGYLSHTDEQIGRLLGAIDALGVSNDTMVIYIGGDNGPSGEFGVQGHDYPGTVAERLKQADQLGLTSEIVNHYSYGWAWAGATPFPGTKAIASHVGGLRAPMVIKWPALIEKSGTRTEFTHVVDIAPTIYEVTGTAMPREIDGVEQIPLAGISLVHSFPHPDSSYNRRTQYFEMLGNRAIFSDGWLASLRIRDFIDFWSSETLPSSSATWELYDLNRDFSQSHNVATRYPERLREMQALFARDAAANAVQPIMDGPIRIRSNSVALLSGRAEHVTVYPDADHVPASAFAVHDRPYRIDVVLDVEGSMSQAKLLALCEACELLSAGVFLSVQGHQVELHYLDNGIRKTLDAPLTLGRNELRFEVSRHAADKWVNTFFVNGHHVGHIDITGARGSFSLMPDARAVTNGFRLKSVRITPGASPGADPKKQSP